MSRQILQIAGLFASHFTAVASCVACWFLHVQSCLALVTGSRLVVCGRIPVGWWCASLVVLFWAIRAACIMQAPCKCRLHFMQEQ